MGLPDEIRHAWAEFTCSPMDQCDYCPRVWVRRFDDAHFCEYHLRVREYLVGVE